MTSALFCGAPHPDDASLLCSLLAGHVAARHLADDGTAWQDPAAGEPGTVRLLLTGSRTWTDAARIEAELRNAVTRHVGVARLVLVHGACPDGADAIADRLWADWHTACPTRFESPERWPRHLFDSFRRRNEHMVALGARECLAFATRWESGTGQTARMARRAGITVHDYGVRTV